MSYLAHAKALAANGYFVFPAGQDKRPVYGFMDWEKQASRDESLISQWWDKYPDAIPAVAPGRSGLAVVDVDRHGVDANGDDANGYASLSAEGINIDPEWVSGISISGNGQHLWSRHDIPSRNKVFLGVDRKAQGGYVIVPYDLPLAESIVTPLPEKLTLNPIYSSADRRNLSPSDLDEWLETVGGGPLSEPMYSILARFEGTGNSQMSSSIARVVSFAARGFSGAAKALEKMSDIWVSETHYSGDPEAEFMVNVRSAIEKFGRPVSEDSAEAFYALLQADSTVRVSLPSLLQSLTVYCDRIYPEWRENPDWVRVYRACEETLAEVTSVEDVDTWRTKTKEIMFKLWERDNGKAAD